jgi:mRNA interferase MazF
MAITSQAKPGGTIGEAAILEWKRAGLLKPSVLKPLLATIERQLVIRKLGRFLPEDQATLRKSLDEILGP